MSKTLTPTKEKRNIKTFEPDADVASMLNRAESAGIKLVFLCNTSLRKYLTDQGYSRKRDLKETTT